MGNRTEIRAAASGEVYFIDDGHDPGKDIARFKYGNQVRIRHPNGYTTTYAHFLKGSVAVAVGDDVEGGRRLGVSDNSGWSTGPHLHFEVRGPSGRRVNPYGNPPDYTGGCGPGALWVTCPPTPAPPSDNDHDGFTVAQGDCNDSDPTIKPRASERCNAKDDDCDGQTDEPWKSGRASDIGNSCTVGVGACVNTGVYVCTPDGRATVCNVDRLPPQTEQCNAKDDDCDGQTDEPWKSGSASDIGQSCTVGIGACANTGQYICTLDGRATVCNVDALPPQTERCNTIDDDCDGQTDEDWSTGGAALGQPCSIVWDACRGSTSGHWVCTPDGLAVVCDALASNGQPTQREICDGLDNDCDGQTDNLASYAISGDGEYPSVSWSAERGQFGVVWIERQVARGTTILSSRILDSTGVPMDASHEIASENASRSFGTDIAWDGEDYGVVWLNSQPNDPWIYECIFVRINAEGIPFGPARRIGGRWIFNGGSSDLIPRARIVARGREFTVAVYGIPESRVDAGSRSDITIIRFTRTGQTIGDSLFALEDPHALSTRASQLALAIVDGHEVLAWLQGPYSNGDNDLIIGVWEGGVAQRIAVARNMVGWHFGLGLMCADSHTCSLLSSSALYGSAGVGFMHLDIPTMSVSPGDGTSYHQFMPIEASVRCENGECTITAVDRSEEMSPGLWQRTMLTASLRVGDHELRSHMMVGDRHNGSTFAVSHGGDVGVTVWNGSTERPRALDGLLSSPWCP